MVSACQSVAAMARAVRSVFTTIDSHLSRASALAALCAVTVSLAWSGHAFAQQSEGASANQAAAGPTQAAPATAPAAQPPLEEITVTGSRIRRRDLESTSPLVTIDAAQLESKSSTDVVTYLNQLPQYNVAQSPVTEPNDVQPSPTNTPGISTVSLRGLGANRSLVLVDGHRADPVNLLMDVDLNTIPEAAIDHIETITGGASAVYGADAMGGVTNIVLKKNFEGAQLDIQDGVDQAGDGNETRVDGLIGTKIADGKGSILMGLEYYNRGAAYAKDHSFYTNNWYDPNATGASTLALFTQGYNAYSPGLDEPAPAVYAALYPAAAAAGYVSGNASHPNGVCGFTGCVLGDNFFMPNGEFGSNTLPIGVSGWTGNTSSPISNGGYGLVNAYDATECSSCSTPPTEIQTERWNNPYAQISIPQTRYSFFANGSYDITDNVQFYMSSRFADSLTTTLLDTPTTSIFGWEASVPFNPKTDSPINPADLTIPPGNPCPGPFCTPAATAAYNTALAAYTANVDKVVAAFQASPNCASVSCNPYWNPSFIGANKPGAQHPVPWSLAAMLLSRSLVQAGTSFGGPGAYNFLAGLVFGPGAYTSTFYGNGATCSNGVSAAINADCVGGANYVAGTPGVANSGANASSWILDYLPQTTGPQRTTVDQDEMFQITTGLKFPLWADWTGDIYYSRGETLDYEQGLGNLSLERFRSVIDAPDYGGNGDQFLGNQQGASTGFGTTVASTCTSGMYGTIFNYGVAPSTDCSNAIGSVLQTETAMQQDDVEADFNGTVFKLPAGDVSAAVGWEERRDAGQFQPDNLQSTSSFLDQSIGLYPLGVTNQEIYDTDGYAEVFIPLISDVKFFEKLSVDIGGRYSVFSNGIPDAKTYKISPEWQVTKSFHIRGGYNHAVRAPNLGELYLGEQEYFSIPGPVFGDPCSVRSPAPFGAGGAAPDYSGSASAGPTHLASGQTAAGAESTYLICQAQMGGVAPSAANGGVGSGAAGYYYGTTGNQSTDAEAEIFDWLNQEGNSHLSPETANTWTGGFTFNNLGDSPWISGLSGSVDWWQIDINHAIELNSPDEANYLCYGVTTVTTAAQAAAQAATPACQEASRNLTTGGTTTLLEQYNNLATIGIAGVDVGVTWVAQFQDLGLKIPGALSISTLDTFLDYYKTKASPFSFDVDTNWKDSQGPNLADTNPGAFGYRLTGNIGWVLPSWSVNLGWRFLPSVNTVTKATQEAVIQNNETVLATGKGTLLNWFPDNTFAAPAWNEFDLSGTWTINKILQIRGGIDNIFGKNPPSTGATAGYPISKPLDSYCSAAETKLGCLNPGAYAIPNDGVGQTNPAMGYDIYGRTFFLGLKASF